MCAIFLSYYIVPIYYFGIHRLCACALQRLCVYVLYYFAYPICMVIHILHKYVIKTVLNFMLYVFRF